VGLDVLKQVLQECRSLCGALAQSLEGLGFEEFSLEKLEQFSRLLCREDMREESASCTDCIRLQFDVIQKRSQCLIGRVRLEP
jgi:hypothetical protein